MNLGLRKTVFADTRNPLNTILRLALLRPKLVVNLNYILNHYFSEPIIYPKIF